MTPIQIIDEQIAVLQEALKHSVQWPLSKCRDYWNRIEALRIKRCEVYAEENHHGE